ncbi:MAG: hypothetical protein LBP65_01900 [Puniceicoccales bacterium]|jgi:hypothetical protein|nr:hypothetical protein [Puniceicoccales bacterium]
MDPLTIAIAAAQMLSGIAGNRASKRQAEASLLSADVEKLFTQSNILKSATEGFGKSLIASAHGGGFAPNAFSGSWSNVAADYNAAQTRANMLSNNALAQSSADRMGTLFNTATSLLSLWNGRRTAKANRSLLSSSSPSTSSLD